MFKFWKRCFDIASATLLLLAISPLLLILIIAVRINMGSPVFFKQQRTGMNFCHFTLIKFRSMTDARDAEGNLLPDHLRVTKFGKLLRSSSLDELPELLNIIRGDMSVIGPRPLLCRYDSFYTEEEKQRFLVRGGLISPDSLSTEPVVSWNNQLKEEAYYGEHLNFFYDVRIFIRVFIALFKRAKTNFGGFERIPLDEERANNKRV